MHVFIYVCIYFLTILYFSSSREIINDNISIFLIFIDFLSGNIFIKYWLSTCIKNIETPDNCANISTKRLFSAKILKLFPDVKFWKPRFYNGNLVCCVTSILQFTIPDRDPSIRLITNVHITLITAPQMSQSLLTRLAYSTRFLRRPFVRRFLIKRIIRRGHYTPFWALMTDGGGETPICYIAVMSALFSSFQQREHMGEPHLHDRLKYQSIRRGCFLAVLLSCWHRVCNDVAKHCTTRGRWRQIGVLMCRLVAIKRPCQHNLSMLNLMFE